VPECRLSRFASENTEVAERLDRMILDDDFVTDYQRMYVLGSLLTGENVSRSACNTALGWLCSTTVAKETRAIAAIFVARHGNANQKRAVRLAYEDEPSNYARAAILYASRYFVSAERRTCRRAWGGHNQLNALIAQANANAT